MSNILVTGGAGFIGSQLGYKLHKKDHEIILIDNESKEKNLIKELKEAVNIPIIGNGDVVWQAAGIYNGGDQVTHQGNKYEAKWWTQGDEPGVADVWKAL